MRRKLILNLVTNLYPDTNSWVHYTVTVLRYGVLSLLSWRFHGKMQREFGLLK